MNTVELSKSKAILFSATQVGLGMYLRIKGGDSLKRIGSILISAGLSSGVYAYQTDKDQRKYDDREYAKRFGYGVLTGILTGGLAQFTQNVRIVARISLQFFGSAASSAVVNSVFEAIDGKKANLKLIGRKALIAGVGGGSGVVCEAVTTSLLSTEISSHIFNNLIAKVSDDDVARNVLLNTFKKMIEAGLNSGNCKFVTGVCENLEERDPEKKKKLRVIIIESLQSALIGAALTGVLSALEQKERIQKFERAKKQLAQNEKELTSAEFQKNQSENTLQALREKLEKIKLNLAEKLNAIKQNGNELAQKKRDKELVQKRIEQNQIILKNLQPVVEVAKEKIIASEQDILDDKLEIEKCQTAIREAEQKVSENSEQLTRAKQTADTAKQLYDKEVTFITSNIQQHLKRGFKAKVHGRKLYNEEEIRQAYLNGDKIVWKKHHTKETLQLKSSDSLLRYNNAQKTIEETAGKIQALATQIENQKMDIQIANQNTKLILRDVDAHQEPIKSYDRVQSTVNSDQVQSNLLERDIHQIQLGEADRQSTVHNLQQELSYLQAQMQIEQKKLVDVLRRVSGLTSLTKEPQLSVERIQLEQPLQYIDHLSALNKALQAEPISYVETDYSLEQLIPHIVLVHALNYSRVPVHIAMEMVEKCNDEDEKMLFFLKRVLTPEGVLGQHLELEKREFGDSLVERPHLHWSWNQLVQPNSAGGMIGNTPVNSWEEDQIALLEPLRTFENRIYYKPFGVSPYDTFTFSSHRFSNQSVLLVPETLVVKVRAYMKDFKGKIVPIKGPLRPAIIDALQTHYPETWHICDEEGHLTGRQCKLSPGGFTAKTCIKTTDGKVVVLINNDGNRPEDQRSSAFKEYRREQRYIGIHNSAVTFWIEDTENKYFKTLKEVKENRTKVKDNPLFAGNVTIRDKEVDFLKVRQLGALEAYKFYQKALEHDVRTGILNVAKYLINEAIFADLVSLPSGFELSVLDLKMICESAYFYLFTLLDDIATNARNNGLQNQKKAKALFIEYHKILNQCLLDINRAKEESLKLTTLNPKQVNSLDKKPCPLCLSIAQEEWDKVEVPPNTEFDLAKNWPHSDQLKDYANKVLRGLPANVNDLSHLSQQLSEVPIRDQKEQYRVNIISSIIRYALQEQLYLEHRGRVDNMNSILANKLSRHKGELAEYGLVSEDFTKNRGDSLFDNIRAQLFNRFKTTEQLREEIVKHMCACKFHYLEKLNPNTEIFEGDDRKKLHFKDWEQYLACMAKSQVWGTELEIQAIADKMDSPVVVLTDGLQPKIFNQDGKSSPLFLHLLFWNYFESCVPFKGLTVAEVFNAIKKKLTQA